MSPFLNPMVTLDSELSLTVEGVPAKIGQVRINNIHLSPEMGFTFNIQPGSAQSKLMQAGPIGSPIPHDQSQVFDRSQFTDEEFVKIQEVYDILCARVKASLKP